VKRVPPYLLAAIVAAAAGIGTYHLLQADDLRREGYLIGLRHGEVKAARAGPPAVRDIQQPLEELTAAAAWRALGPLDQAEQEGLAALLNRAPSPCWKQARRGHSVATNLVDPELECAGVDAQVELALAALRTFPGDQPEALAVLRAERRARPDVAGRPLRGNPDADVIIVEYGDFQCPYCERVLALTDALLEERDDVALAFKHMPLSFHPAALPAALAVEAAAEQDRFWEMHDALFALGKGIGDHVDRSQPVPEEGPVPFEGLAEELGIDVDRYRADFRSAPVRARVDADQAEARALRVSGTPTFFVDSRRVEERLSLPMLTRLVDKASAERRWHFSWDLEPPPPGAQDGDDDSAEAVGE
jgi:protein-disulfide isomerase